MDFWATPPALLLLRDSEVGPRSVGSAKEWVQRP